MLNLFGMTTRKRRNFTDAERAAVIAYRNDHPEVPIRVLAKHFDRAQSAIRYVLDKQTATQAKAGAKGAKPPRAQSDAAELARAALDIEEGGKNGKPKKPPAGDELIHRLNQIRVTLARFNVLRATINVDTGEVEIEHQPKRMIKLTT